MSIVAFSWPFVVAFTRPLVMFHSMVAVIALGVLGPTAAMMPLTILRHIHIVIPMILHEIYRTTACIVLATIIAPLLCMPRRNMQIDWLIGNAYRPYDDGLRVNQHRTWEITDIDASVKAWLTNRNRDADIGCRDWQANKSGCHE